MVSITISHSLGSFLVSIEPCSLSMSFKLNIIGSVPLLLLLLLLLLLFSS